MTEHDDLPALDEGDERGTPRRRLLAVAAAVLLVTGTVAIVGQGDDDRSQVDVEELPDLEPSVLQLLGPRDGRDSIRLPITVEPAAGLQDGDVVTVSGSGFVPGERVGIVQCAREAGGDTVQGGVDGCYLGDVQYADADDGGTATGTYTVRRALTTPMTGTVDCAAEADRCVVAMGALDDYDRSGGAPIQLAPGGPPLDLPTVTVDPTDGLADGQMVRVSGEGFEPDELLDVLVCSADPSGCWSTGQPVELRSQDQRGDGETPGLRADGDGRVEGDVPVWRFLPGPEPGSYIDCAVSECSLRVVSQRRAPPSVALAFVSGGDAPTPPSVGVSRTEGLAPGDVVVVRGEGFAPTAMVWVSLCAGPPGQAELRYTCGSTSELAVQVDDDGSFTLDFEVPELGAVGVSDSEECVGDGCVMEPSEGQDGPVAARCDGVETDCAITVDHHMQGAVAGPPTWSPVPVPITFR